MPAWVAPLIMGGVQLASQLFNKPKQKQADTSYLDRFINDKKGEMSSNAIYNTAMRNASSQVAGASATARDRMTADNYLNGVSGSGISNQQNLSVMGQETRALNEASNNASIQQANNNIRLSSSIDEAMNLKEKIKAETKARYDAEMDNWESGLLATGIGAVGNAATAWGTEAMQQYQQEKELFNKGKAEGLIPEQNDFANFKRELRMNKMDATSYLTKMDNDRIKTSENEYLSGIEDIEAVDTKDIMSNPKLTAEHKASLINEKLKWLAKDVSKTVSYDQAGNKITETANNAGELKTEVDPRKPEYDWKIDKESKKEIEYNTQTGEPTGNYRDVDVKETFFETDKATGKVREVNTINGMPVETKEPKPEKEPKKEPKVSDKSGEIGDKKADVKQKIAVSRNKLGTASVGGFDSLIKDIEDQKVGEDANELVARLNAIAKGLTPAERKSIFDTGGGESDKEEWIASMTDYLTQLYRLNNVSKDIGDF